MAVSEEKVQEMINAAVTAALASAKAPANGNGAGSVLPGAQTSMFAAPAAGAAGGFGAQPVVAVAATTLPSPEAVLIPGQYYYGDKSTLSFYLAFPGSVVPNMEALAALCESLRGLPWVRIWKPDNQRNGGGGFKTRY